MTPLRARLMSPPNAVPDPGIDLHRRANLAPFAPMDITKPKPYPGFWFWPIEEKLTIDAIMESCSEVFEVSISDLRSPSRHMPLVKYRMAAMAICCHLSHLALIRIGQKFGGRDHCTVLNARKKMAFHMAAVAATLPEVASTRDWAAAMKARLG